MSELFELKKAYRLRRAEITGRLSDFKKLKSASQERIFEELCFCLLTPQSKAEECDKIISNLRNQGGCLHWRLDKLRPFLKRARFYKKKAEYLILALKLFSKAGELNIREKIDRTNPLKTRRWLIDNVKGLGYKEASHFLRNIGLGEDLAILDIHILRRLEKLGVIDKVARSLSGRTYLSIESRLKEFSSKIGIPMSHLDLLFWSMAAGKIFK